MSDQPSACAQYPLAHIIIMHPDPSSVMHNVGYSGVRCAPASIHVYIYLNYCNFLFTAIALNAVAVRLSQLVGIFVIFIVFHVALDIVLLYRHCI